MLYGSPPERMGFYDLKPKEMLFWLYCPISLPGSEQMIVPGNLRHFRPLLDAVTDDIGWSKAFDSYLYITAKTLWVTTKNLAQRPGWHSDGFGTDDLNYIWCDKWPTEFICPNELFELSEDCEESYVQMNHHAQTETVYTYGENELLKLTPAVIHRAPTCPLEGFRSFVKISVSEHLYNLEGNSINHELNHHFELKPRARERNHPHRAA